MADATYKLTIDTRPAITALREFLKLAGNSSKQLNQVLSGVKAKIDFTEFDKATKKIESDLKKIAKPVKSKIDVDVDSKRAEKDIKKVDSDIKKIPGKKTLTFESNAGNLITNIRDIGLALQAVTRGYRMVKDVIGNAINLATIQAEAEKKVEQAIRATGGACGYTTDQLKKMAKTMQQELNIGDEKILESQAILLSFTNVTGEQFPRALETAANISAVMTKQVDDISGSLVQLAKALNDPITNLTALSRSGIQFSEDQKELIKSLWQAGEQAKAQTVILDELEVQYGGQAKALRDLESGELRAYRLALGDLKERLGAVGQSVVVDVVKNLRPLVKGIDETHIKIGLVTGVIGGLLVLMPKLITSIQALGVATSVSLGPISLAISTIGGLVTAYVLLHKSTEEVIQDQIDEAQKRQDTIKEIKNQKDAHLKLLQAYLDLSSQEKLTTDQESDLKTIRDKITQQFPDLQQGTEGYKKKIIELKGEIEELNQAELGQLTRRLRLEFEKQKKLADKAGKDIVTAVISKFTEKERVKIAGFLNLTDITKDSINDLEKYYNYLGKFIQENEVRLALSEGKERKLLERKGRIYAELQDKIKDFITAKKDVAKSESEYNTILEGGISALKELRKEQQITNEVLDDVSKKQLNDKDLKKYYETVKFTDKNYYEWKKALIEKTVDDMELNAEQKVKMQKDLIQRLKNEESAYIKSKKPIPMKFSVTGMEQLKALKLEGKVVESKVKITVEGEEYNKLSDALARMDETSIANIEVVVEGEDKVDQINKILSQPPKPKKISTDAIEEYYESVKFADKEYYAWKKEQIENEVEALSISEDKKALLKEQKLQELESAELSYFDRILDAEDLSYNDRIQAINDFYNTKIERVKGNIDEEIRLEQEKENKLKELKESKKDEGDAGAKNEDIDYGIVMDRRTQAEQEAYEQRLENVNQYYEKQNQALLDAGYTQEEIERQKEERIAGIKEEFATKAIVMNTKFYENLGTIAKAFGKKGFLTWKRMAQAQAIVDTYAGAQAAFKAMAGIPIVGPILGGIAAAAAIASGLMRVKQIEKMKYAGGGYTGEGIGDRDETGKRIAGVVHEKELVFEEEITTPNLKELISLREILKKGIPLKKILMPEFTISTIIPNIRPRLSYAIGGYTGEGFPLNNNAVLIRLEKIENAVRVMNMNLVEKEMTINIKSEIDGVKFIKETIEPSQERIEEKKI